MCYCKHPFLFGILFFVACGSARVLSLRSPSPAPHSTPVATRMVYVAPVNPLGHQMQNVTISETVYGDCEPASEVVGSDRVYRCFASNGVYDPCWAVGSSKTPTGSVLCRAIPWSKSAVRIVTTGLPSVTGNFHTDPDHPWGVRLVTGENCLAAQGAHDSYNGHVIEE